MNESWPRILNQRVGALRFFFIKTLKKAWSVDETPYPKRVIRLPKIFSPEEVAQLIDSATTPFYPTILMTLYATGMRRAELAYLKISDIDSQRMVLHVQGGKGRKDRDIMLSPKLLEAPAGALARFETETQGVAVPRQSLTHSRLSDHHQGRLAKPRCGLA